jgi:hypothetical protein
MGSFEEWHGVEEIGGTPRSKCDLEDDLGETIAQIHFFQGKIVCRIL